MGPDLPALSEDCNFPIKTRLREVKLLHGALFYVLSLDWKIKEANFGSIINVGVRKYSFLTPFLHKKVDIDGIHSYN